jgi:large subunit ribosomal protein L17
LFDTLHKESVIVNKDLVNKLVHDIANRFKTRQGGYLRLVKLGSRSGDNAPMVRMELVSKTLVPAVSASDQPKVVEPKTSPTPTVSKVSSKKVSPKTKTPAKSATKKSASAKK